VTQTFHFSVVSFVPHPIRQERINIGVVVVSDEPADYGVRFTKAYKEKLRAIAPDVHSNTISDFVKDFYQRFMNWSPESDPDDLLHPSLATLSSLSELEGAQVVFSSPRAFVTEGNAPQVLQNLFARYISPYSAPKQIQIGRPEVRQTIRKALRRWSVPESDVIEGPRLAGRLDSHRVDIGIMGTNGHSRQVVAALEPISFRINSASDIETYRDHIAFVASDLAEDANRPTICAVVTTPIPNNQDLFDRSLRLFDEFGVRVVDNDDIEDLRSVIQTARVPTA
jgi:hypothetical protein